MKRNGAVKAVLLTSLLSESTAALGKLLPRGASRLSQATKIDYLMCGCTILLDVVII